VWNEFKQFISQSLLVLFFFLQFFFFLVLFTGLTKELAKVIKEKKNVKHRHHNDYSNTRQQKWKIMFIHLQLSTINMANLKWNKKIFSLFKAHQFS
jgi:hypothetical protein